MALDINPKSDSVRLMKTTKKSNRLWKAVPGKVATKKKPVAKKKAATCIAKDVAFEILKAARPSKAGPTDAPKNLLAKQPNSWAVSQTLAEPHIPTKHTVSQRQTLQ